MHSFIKRSVFSLAGLMALFSLPAPASANYSADSLYELGQTLSAQGDSSGVQNGGTLTINGGSLGSFDYVVIDGNTTISSGWTATDYFSTTADSKAAVVVVNGDLTIDNGETFTPSARKLFTYIYVTGNITVNGGISMTARGANHSAGGGNVTATEIRIYNGTLSGVTNPNVPAAGGSGAAAVITTPPRCLHSRQQWGEWVFRRDGGRRVGRRGRC